MQLLIGSRAAKYHFHDFREPKDFDYLTDETELKSSKETEYHYVVNDGLKELLLLEYSLKVASPESLYSLKLSHSCHNVHWAKTMWDIKFFQEKKIQCNYSMYCRLKTGWEFYHATRVNLKKSNDKFFEDKVDRKYVHDSIHMAVAYYDRPLYETVKYDVSAAKVERTLFNGLDYEDRLRLCWEEIYVIALERYLIPRNFSYSILSAYRNAACDLVTRMTKGWFPEFIVFNWSLLEKPDINFVAKFRENTHLLKVIDNEAETCKEMCKA